MQQNQVDYVVTGLAPGQFDHLFGLSTEALSERSAVRCVADRQPGFPCRITLEDALPGETLLLLNHTHLPGSSPYRSSHAIFVRENAHTAARLGNAVPEMLQSRLLSVRAFDDQQMMIDASVVPGSAVEPLWRQYLASTAISFLHVHTAAYGCYLCRVDRNSTDGTR